MCFEFGCFGGGRREDYGGDRPAHKPPQGHGRDRRRRGIRRNDEHYGGAGDHKAAPPAAYHNQPHAAILDEAGHKAYHDGARKDHHDDAGGHGRYTSYVLDKVDYDMPKLPAWHNKVGDDAGYTYTYTALPHEAAAGSRQNAAMDYHHYPTTTASTATFVRR
uniref:Uncharacterized protein n=1 Tax=Avena sativa TaxID=4498 RepID=A0ACD5VC35_AVESA